MITLADIKDASGAVLEAEKLYDTKKGKEIVKEINDKLGLKAGRPEEMVGINTYLNGVTISLVLSTSVMTRLLGLLVLSMTDITTSILAVMVCSVTTGMN